MTVGELTGARTHRPRRFYGKYRGVVVDNLDPLGMARVLAACPAIADGPLTWAMPCVPWGGDQVGTFIVPPSGAGVWIEFEQGDIDYPIWTGCYWNEPEEIPALARALLGQPGIAVQGAALNGIVLGNGPTGSGSLTLKCAGASIDISEAEGIVITSGAARIAIQIGEIEISNGIASIVLSGPTVTVNDGALEVL